MVMAEMGHTDPALALRVYAQAVRRGEGRARQAAALVEGVEFSPDVGLNAVGSPANSGDVYPDGRGAKSGVLRSTTPFAANPRHRPIIGGSLVRVQPGHVNYAVVRMSALLDGRAGVWDTASVLLYVGLAIVCVNLLAVAVIARLGRRLSGTSHEALPRAGGNLVPLTRRAGQRARARPAVPRHNRRRAARGRAL